MNRAFTKTTLAAAITAAALVGGAAQARVSAFAVLNIMDFEFYNDTTNTLLSPPGPGSIFTAANGNNNGDTAASIVGGASDDDSASTPIANSVGEAGDAGVVAPDGVLTRSCVGACGGIALDDYSIPPAVVGNTGTFASADGDLDATNAGAFGPSPGADAQTNAFAQVGGTSAGETTSQSNLGLNLAFTITGDLDLRVEFDASAYLEASVDADATDSSSALASTSWSIRVRSTSGSGYDVTYAPTELQNTAGVNVPPGVSDSITLALTSFSNVFDLAAGSYNLTVRHTTEADANQAAVAVPEPSMLALLGLGLAGLGFAQRRRTLN